MLRTWTQRARKLPPFACQVCWAEAKAGFGVKVGPPCFETNCGSMMDRIGSLSRKPLPTGQ
jgi:hypothetical protein